LKRNPNLYIEKLMEGEDPIDVWREDQVVMMEPRLSKIDHLEYRVDSKAPYPSPVSIGNQCH
jgi:hypothetical protein